MTAPGALPIRAATPADLDAIVALEAACFAADRIARRSFARLLRRASAVVLVADGGSGPVGSAVVLFRMFSRRARLYSLAVAPPAGGQGLGTRLLSAAEGVARQRGCTALSLEVRADNALAIGLYEKRNYRLIGRTENYYSDGAAALHYLTSLATPQRDPVVA